MPRAILCTVCLLAALAFVSRPASAETLASAVPAASAAVSAPAAPVFAALFATDQPVAPFLTPAPSGRIACATVVCIAPCHCTSPQQPYCANLERCICGCR